MSAVFSGDPTASFIDSKQLVLFVMVPVVMMFARGSQANRVLDVIIALGSAGALFGIVQYAVLGYDSLAARRPGVSQPLDDVLGRLDARDVRGGGAASLLPEN